VTVKKNKIENNTMYGVYISESAFNRIANCTIRSTGDYGVYLEATWDPVYTLNTDILVLTIIGFENNTIANHLNNGILVGHIAIITRSSTTQFQTTICPAYT